MRFFALLTVLVLWLAPFSAHAAVNSATPSPARVSIAPQGPTTLNITWSVVDTSPTTGTVNISSANAFLQVNGTNVATLAGSLSQSRTLTIGQVVNLTFTETLTISPALARQISKYGAGSVRIRRVFTDGAGTAAGDLPVSTGNIGPLSVNRIELKFENAARTDVVQKGDTLRAVADVSFRSNGLLRGEWRLVDPTASLGGQTSGRRVLQVVRQQLVSSGEGRTRIVSPLLPTDKNGLYFLSFSVEDTDSTIDIPILRYFVLEGRDDVPPTNVSILAPANTAVINPETVFSWNAVPGAQAYQLEILETGGETPLTAKLVPASDLKLLLSTLSFEDLSANTLYDWRVRALANGTVIGQSERYILKTQ